MRFSRRLEAWVNYRTPHTDQNHVIDHFQLIEDDCKLQSLVTVTDQSAFNMLWSAGWRRLMDGACWKICVPRITPTFSAMTTIPFHKQPSRTSKCRSCRPTQPIKLHGTRSYCSLYRKLRNTVRRSSIFRLRFKRVRLLSGACVARYDTSCAGLERCLPPQPGPTSRPATPHALKQIESWFLIFVGKLPGEAAPLLKRFPTKIEQFIDAKAPSLNKPGSQNA